MILGRMYVRDRKSREGTDLMRDAWQMYGGTGNMKVVKARGWRVASVVGEFSVGPPLEVDPVGQMRLRIQNKQTTRPVN